MERVAGFSLRHDKNFVANLKVFVFKTILLQFINSYSLKLQVERNLVCILGVKYIVSSGKIVTCSLFLKFFCQNICMYTYILNLSQKLKFCIDFMMEKFLVAAIISRKVIHLDLVSESLFGFWF